MRRGYLTPPVLIGLALVCFFVAGTFFLHSLLVKNVKTQPIPTPFAQSSPKSKATSTDGCKITGCSSQVCSDQDVITTCEWRAEFACYKNARCELQPDGKCGWTPTEELTKCLETTKSSSD
ncbi:hypothetical protein HYU92_01060 [Candidatus Curtissbacteria bacterium]|nr:hypothetical protein [Candidatus Curtissbacteria bacterium]